jgi:hypothetical protein
MLTRNISFLFASMMTPGHQTEATLTALIYNLAHGLPPTKITTLQHQLILTQLG